MSTPETCPCDAVRDLKVIVERHDRLLNEQTTQNALIQQDLGYIKAKLDKKERFNTQTLSSIVQAVCSILLAFVAAKIGFGA